MRRLITAQQLAESQRLIGYIDGYKTIDMRDNDDRQVKKIESVECRECESVFTIGLTSFEGHILSVKCRYCGTLNLVHID